MASASASAASSSSSPSSSSYGIAALYSLKEEVKNITKELNKLGDDSKTPTLENCANCIKLVEKHEDNLLIYCRNKNDSLDYSTESCLEWCLEYLEDAKELLEKKENTPQNILKNFLMVAAGIWEEKYCEYFDDWFYDKLESERYKPKFVINTIAYVPSDSDNDTESEDSSDENNISFSESEFKNPPYKINSDSRGKLQPGISLPEVKTTKNISRVIDPLCKKLEKESFAETGCLDETKNLAPEAAKYASLSIFLNRPRSLSKAKNRLLTKELKAPLTSRLPCKPFAAFWDYQWRYEAPVYISFIDADTISFKANSESVGIYLNYQREILARYILGTGWPTVLSSGYEFPLSSGVEAWLWFSSILDRGTRVATAAVIPKGVYYPEPNLTVHVPDDKETIEESFIGDGSYGMESPTLLKAIDINREHCTYHFLSGNPLVTQAPERAKQNKQGAVLTFKGHYDKQRQKFVDWTTKDITKIYNVAQSHASHLQWAHNVLHAFPPFITQSRTFKVGRKYFIETNGVTLRLMTVSLLSRLMKSFDPIIVCECNPSTFADLKKYDSYIKSDVIDSSNKAESGSAEDQGVWGILDNITSRKILKKHLMNLLQLDESGIDDLENAARQSGKAIQKIFCRFLSGPEDATSSTIQYSHSSETASCSSAASASSSMNASSVIISRSSVFETNKLKTEKNDIKPVFRPS